MARRNQHRIIIREAGESLYKALLFDYGATWRYSQVANGAEAGFEAAAYDDSAFSSGASAFGYVLNGEQTQGANQPPCVMNRTLVQTTWDLGTDMLLRKTLVIPTGTTKLYFEFGVDNQAYVYLDGNLVNHTSTGGSCQTRGSSSFWVENPPTGTVILAVRAIDNAQSEPGGTDGYTGILKESFFDMKVEAHGAGLTGAGAATLWNASTVDDWSNIIGNASTNMFDGNDTTYSSVLQGGVAGYWCTVEPMTVQQIRVLWRSSAESKEFYIEACVADDVSSTFLPAALGGGDGPTANPGGTWVTVIHAVDGQGGNGDYTDYEGNVHTNVGWNNAYPGSDYTFDVGGAGVTARLWRFRVPAAQGNSDIRTVSASGTPAEVELFTGGRGPETITAVLYDAKAVGLSKFHNGAGELYFTLPNSHDAITKVRPWQDHWAYEVYTAEGWVEKSAGWITDYDATDEETVFYGLDYLGCLALTADERFNPDQSPDAAALLWPDDMSGSGGAKYVDERIDAIIIDQLQRAIHAPNSNLGFLTVGGIAAMSETVSIYCTLAERLSFVVGLIDSHRAGTGSRTRLVVEKWGEGDYRFEVVENPGELREDLTVRDGEVVQGFRLVPFGDYGNRALAIGKTATGFRLEYDIEQTPAPAGEDADYYERRYGRQSKINYWQDIIDVNDLKRRALQYAATVGALGKRLGLGLRVDAIGVEDGWTIGDSMPVDIQQGPVDTRTMGPNGDGSWTIWGWALFIDTDGHTEMILTLLPRELESSLDPDLATSVTIQPPNDITVSDSDPDTTTSPSTGATWFNTTNGHVWIVDPATGLWYDATAAGDMTAIAIALTVKDEGVALATSASIIDFVGAGVVASGTGATKTVTISGVPQGSAGGDLSGTYPNPSVQDDSHSHTASTAAGQPHYLVIASGHSTPLVFDDIIQNSAGDDFVYTT